MRWRERKHYRTRRAEAANGASPVPSSGDPVPRSLVRNSEMLLGSSHVSTLASGPDPAQSLILNSVGWVAAEGPEDLKSAFRMVSGSTSAGGWDEEAEFTLRCSSLSRFTVGPSLSRLQTEKKAPLSCHFSERQATPRHPEENLAFAVLRLHLPQGGSGGTSCTALYLIVAWIQALSLPSQTRLAPRRLKVALNPAQRPVPMPAAALCLTG